MYLLKKFTILLKKIVKKNKFNNNILQNIHIIGVRYLKKLLLWLDSSDRIIRKKIRVAILFSNINTDIFLHAKGKLFFLVKEYYDINMSKSNP